MKRLINFLRGTVTVRVRGTFLERYFNICAAAGLGFWESRLCSETELEVTLARRDLSRAIRLGEKAQCQVEVVRRQGLPALLPLFRRRYGMAAGVLLLAAVLCVLNQFVLVIEIEGSERVSQSLILTQLQRHGFGIGSYGPGVDVRELSNSMLLEMEELSFLTVNITGIRARVIVREADPAPELLDRDRAADLVAARDGVVLRVDLQGGRRVAEKGQAVLKGEVLISGLIVNQLEDGSETVLSTKQVMARGEVWAMTSRTLQAVTPLAALEPDETEEKQGYGLTLLGRRFNFCGNSSNWDSGCDKMTILYPITLPDGQRLPFGLWRIRLQPWTQARIDADSAELFLRRTLTERLESLLGEEGQILGTSWSTERTDGAVRVTLQAQCVEQIGETVYLE